MGKVKRYNFKLGISRGKVKKILNSHDIKFPKGLVVKKLNNIDYISFTSDSNTNLESFTLNPSCVTKGLKPSSSIILWSFIW